MSLLHDQLLLDTHEELIVDCFCGGGGASSGIEEATGRMVDIAINHNAMAVEMHRANHPQTEHFQSDVFEIEPRLVTQGRPIGLLWASPDCTFHSKARGAKPIRETTKKRRALAWVVTRWAGQVRPRVIMLENVEEFAKWGPLRGPKDNLRPCPKRKGKTFRRWVKSLTDLGYIVEWKELRACDYGTPTIRKRLFLIARCDGKPIEWPAATHADPNAKGFEASGLKPWRAIAECIDWTIPMLSIFATKEEAKEWAKFHGVSAPIRPLADKSMSRIARGVKKFVLDNPKPFLVTLTHSGSRQPGSVGDPITTITGAHRGEVAVVSPFTVPRYGEREGQEPRCASIEVPAPVIVPGANGSSLCAANLVSYHSETTDEARASTLELPIPTIDTSNRHAVVASFLGQYRSGFAEGNSDEGHSLEQPVSTISTKGPHQAVVAAFMDQANGGYENRVGRAIDEPISTILTEGRGHQGIIAAHVQRDFGQSVGSSGDEPIGAITGGGGGHAAVVATNLMTNTTGSVGSGMDEPAPTFATGNHQYMVASFLAKYYGTTTGQNVDEPVHTISAGAQHHGLVTVKIGKELHVIADIGMRMLQPKELYLAQGFRPGYIFDHYYRDGIVKEENRIPITKTEQVKMCGNSVCPPMARALVNANLPDMIVRKAGRVA